MDYTRHRILLLALATPLSCILCLILYLNLDINECLTYNGGCNHICTNKPATFQCSCRSGFYLLSDGKTCNDIDECIRDKPCDHLNGICTSVPGNYYCSCKMGFQILWDKKTCGGNCLFHYVATNNLVKNSLSIKKKRHPPQMLQHFWIHPSCM